MAQRCRIFDVQLSRNPRDILGLLEAARYQQRPPTPKVSVQVYTRASSTKSVA
jgi:hypothetical protein